MSKVNYTSVIKFPATQRLWKGDDGHFYLADESADEDPWYGNGRRQVVGRPDQTDDGPLRIVLSEPIVPYYREFEGSPEKGSIDFYGFHVTVEAVHADNDRTRCGVCIDGALYLAAHLGLTIAGKFPKGLYRVNPLPEVNCGE